MKDTINKLVSDSDKNDHEEYLAIITPLLDKLKAIKSEDICENAFKFRLALTKIVFTKQNGVTVFDSLNDMCKLPQVEELEEIITERANNMLIEKEAGPDMCYTLDNKLLEKCILLAEISILRVKLESPL